jgi:hypothetical protein
MLAEPSDLLQRKPLLREKAAEKDERDERRGCSTDEDQRKS